MLWRWFRIRWGWLTDGDDEDLWLDAQVPRDDWVGVRAAIRQRHG